MGGGISLAVGVEVCGAGTDAVGEREQPSEGAADGGGGGGG